MPNCRIIQLDILLTHDSESASFIWGNRACDKKFKEAESNIPTCLKGPRFYFFLLLLQLVLCHVATLRSLSANHS